MNVDLILSTFNRHAADYLLIGGMNFFMVLPEQERKHDRLRALGYTPSES
jgi:hypothetical protein